MRSYTITLTSNQNDTIPQVLDHHLFFDTILKANFTYPNSADGSLFTETTGTFVYPFTADDALFEPWGYTVQITHTDINIGPLKGPYTVVFSPTGLDTSKFNISKIVYDFGDGETQTIFRVIDPEDRYANGSTLSAGDPNSINISHDYYPSSTTEVTVYKPTITVYNSHLVQNTFNINISTVPLSLYDLSEVHLINSVQQYNKNETQNIFEIRQPDYLTVGRVISAYDPLYPKNVYPFNPNNSLPEYPFNLILWLDAADGPTLQKDSNDNVLTWVDKSSYEVNFTANGIPPHYLSERRSDSGRRSVRFNNSSVLEGVSNGVTFDSIFYGPNSSDQSYGYTIFFVGHLNTVAGTVFSYDINDASNAIYPNLNVSFDTTNSLTVDQGHIPGDISSIYQPTVISNISNNLSSYSLYSITLSSNNNYWEGGINNSVGALNATAIITADTLVVRKRNQNYKFNINDAYNPSLSYLLIGGSNAYPDRGLVDAEISELMIFNTPLNDSARAVVQDYLINKWGLTLKTN